MREKEQNRPSATIKGDIVSKERGVPSGHLWQGYQLILWGGYCGKVIMLGGIWT